MRLMRIFYLICLCLFGSNLLTSGFRLTERSLNGTALNFAIPRSKERKVQVGIVGEIYIKFSPLGNNNLEDFLLQENCEVVIPGFLDFCLYCINDSIVENKMYGGKLSTRIIYKIVFEYFCRKQQDLINIIKKTRGFPHTSGFQTH